MGQVSDVSDIRVSGIATSVDFEIGSDVDDILLHPAEGVFRLSSKP